MYRYDGDDGCRDGGVDGLELICAIVVGVLSGGTDACVQLVPLWGYAVCI